MKLVGAFLLVTGCVLVGHVQASMRERRVKELATLLAALHMLETEVVFGRTLLGEAWLKISRAYPDVSWLFQKAATALQRGMTAAAAWQIGLDARRAGSSLLAGDCAPLERLKGVLGLSDAEDQARHLQLARMEVAAVLQDAREALPKTSRLYRALGLAGGLVAVIFLY